jgi:hypothetical protein
MERIVKKELDIPVQWAAFLKNKFRNGDIRKLAADLNSCILVSIVNSSLSVY